MALGKTQLAEFYNNRNHHQEKNALDI